MFNVSLWPHIRTRFDWKQLGFRTFLTLLPPAGFALYIWGWKFGAVLLVSFLAGFIGHMLASRRDLRKWNDLGFVNDILLINLLMPAETSVLVPAGLTLACGLFRTFYRDKEVAFPVNFPLMLVLLATITSNNVTGDAGFASVIWNGALLRGQSYFISGWIPAALTIIFSFIFLNRLYKWRILIAGIPMNLVFIYLQYRAGGYWDGIGFSWFLNLLLFSLGVLGTDQASTPSKHWGQYWYGLTSGLLIFVFSIKGLFLTGVLVSPLIASLLTPLLDKIGAMNGNLTGIIGHTDESEFTSRRTDTTNKPNI